MTYLVLAGDLVPVGTTLVTPGTTLVTPDFQSVFMV